MCLIDKSMKERWQGPSRPNPLCRRGLSVVKPHVPARHTNRRLPPWLQRQDVDKSVAVLRGSSELISFTNKWRPEGLRSWSMLQLWRDLCFILGAVQWLGVEKRTLQRVAFKDGFNYYMEIQALCCHLSLSLPLFHSLSLSIYIFFLSLTEQQPVNFRWNQVKK